MKDFYAPPDPTEVRCTWGISYVFHFLGTISTANPPSWIVYGTWNKAMVNHDLAAWPASVLRPVCIATICLAILFLPGYNTDEHNHHFCRCLLRSAISKSQGACKNDGFWWLKAAHSPRSRSSSRSSASVGPHVKEFTARTCCKNVQDLGHEVLG